MPESPYLNEHRCSKFDTPKEVSHPSGICMHTLKKRFTNTPPPATLPCAYFPFPGFLAFSQLSEWLPKARGEALVREVQNSALTFAGPVHTLASLQPLLPA